MYRRIILKLSGETLLPDDSSSGVLDESRVQAVAEMLWKLRTMGVEVGVILGGGNIWRGRFAKSMHPANADQMGMLATVINALCVQDAIVRLGGKATVFSAQEMNRFCRLYTRDAALQCMTAGEVVFIAGGSGNPFFTTDTAAALRAAELDAEAIFKGTTVNGVYDKDPNRYGDARFLSSLSYEEAETMNLGVMDRTAFTLCRERRVPEIRVFSMEKLDTILDVARGETIGSVVHL